MLNVIFPLKTTFQDYPNFEDEAVLVFMMHCDHSCKGCQNPQFKDYSYCKGTNFFTAENLAKEIEKMAKRINSDKVVLTGGDPLSHLNISKTKLLTRLLKNMKFMIYTGYDIDYVRKFDINFEFIKCGTFDSSQKQTSIKTDEFIRFSSSNQKLYNSKFELISKDGIYYF